MRPDMHEVLIERPRSGGRFKTPRDNKPRVGEWESEDSYARDLRPSRLRTKRFDDLLSPLKRWLHKQVGRPWDKVWSELCASIDSRTVVGRHLLEHARSEVELHCCIDERRRAWVESHRGWHEVVGLYVDPRTRLLRLSKHRHRLHAQGDGSSPDVVHVAGNRFRVKRAGIWYDADVSFLEGHAYHRANYDFEWRWQRCVIGRKTQLGTRELRALGISNDA